VSESFPHLRRGAMRDFLNIMMDLGIFEDSRWSKTENTYTFETGSKIEFFSVDQPDKLRGARRDRLFINEANNVSLEAFEQLEVRTKDYIFLDYNPTNEFWVFTDLLPSRKDVEHLILTYKDNEACPEEIVRSIEVRINNANWFKVYGLGQLGEIESRIYVGWQIIDEIPKEARLERYGLDFGYTTDPTAIIAIYYCNGRYILDEEVYKKGMSNKDIVDTLKQITGEKLKDKMVIADSAEPKSIDEIRAYGLNIQPCTKGKDSVRSGIQLVQDQPISVTKRSVNLIKEYRNYLWATDKDGKYIQPNEPIKGNDHTLDAVRYAFETLGRLKQELNYWDRIWEKELNPQVQVENYNKGK
jgi:phage terminase large subunit